MKKLIILALMGLTVAASAQNTIDKKGLKQGHWIKTDKNGAKIYEGNFKDGKETGTFTYFYGDGSVKMKNTYIVDGKLCAHEAYYENGKLMAKGFYNQKNRDSVWNIYTEEGKLIKIATYKMGIKQGPQVIFNSNGDTAEVSNWMDNKRHGRWWKRIGEKGYITGYYNHGGLEGRLVEFDQSGILCREGYYQKGLKNGTYKFFEGGLMTVDEKWVEGLLQDRKVLVVGDEPSYVSTTSIAYIVPKGTKKTLIMLMNDNVIYSNEPLENFVSRINDNEFLCVDRKNRIYAAQRCIMGITKDAEDRDILQLDPKPSFMVFPDEDCKKLIESMQRTEMEK